MIAGDLDLDRALGDPAYRVAARRFLEGPRGEPPAADPDPRPLLLPRGDAAAPSHAGVVFSASARLLRSSGSTAGNLVLVTPIP